jgi:hypothetical protein
LISRSHVVGLGLVVGLMLAGGTGLAVADSGPSPTPAPTLCKFVTRSGAPTAVAPGSGAQCVAFVPGAIPKGAPGTGGGGMAAEVGSWH